ncbi:hypothetical protein LBBP_01946 [Leptospira borgpetersenii serovar Ballum]|uniref:Uncharacterized protein n=1 Tax=Leptospira borgpetersenii serovar Ballum TaxID=280505 RepID=A0A0S2IRX6_LEPBO|nr:hypothetical protein LBBP_01946 [Leptospira borgpetersenii serovar Ballum]
MVFGSYKRENWDIIYEFYNATRTVKEWLTFLFYGENETNR